ncbi:MAG TPA: hypothetical protein VF623_01045 [Segetibacter sp.]|jgi:hypothetical protein
MFLNKKPNCQVIKWAAVYSAAYAKLLFCLIGIFLTVKASTQTIQYSRQNFKAPYFNTIQLVANVAGNHHILCMAFDSKIVLYVYNDALQLLSGKELQLKLPEYGDINIIPFKRFYYLYIHQSGSANHELWRVDSAGNATSASAAFTGLVDTVFKKNTSTLQLVNKNNHLFIIAHAFYQEIEKIGSSVIEADENLKIVQQRKVFYDFKKNGEGLKQVALVDQDNLLILKTSRDTAGHLLSIIKASLTTGQALENSYNSGSNAFLNPFFNFNPADSSITIYSRIERTLFITGLNYSLVEKAPVTVFKSLFRNPNSYNFLQLNSNRQKWLIIKPGNVFRINSARSVFAPPDSYTNAYNSGINSFGDIDMSFNNFRAAGVRSFRAPGYDSYNNGASSIRFSLLNHNFRIVKDSLVANDKNKYKIHPEQSASAVVAGKSYLFLGQEFGRNSYGLLMMYRSTNDVLSSTDIRVYDKYKYLVPQMQVVNDKYVLLPYTYKKELGLVKITLQ